MTPPQLGSTAGAEEPRQAVLALQPNSQRLPGQRASCSWAIDTLYFYSYDIPRALSPVSVLLGASWTEALELCGFSRKRREKRQEQKGHRH